MILETSSIIKNILILFIASIIQVDDRLVESATNPIIIKGAKLFDSVTKDQFFIKGVAYQPRSTGSANFNDPLAASNDCKRDLPYLQQLGVNAVRVYEVDISQNHDQCMQMFSDAGIYLLLDLPTPDFSINRDNPQWNVDLYNHYTATVDSFAKYPNVLGFFAGNEVTNNKSNTPASAFVKAAIRDLKSYINATANRPIPVGYASNDDQDTRVSLLEYFDCISDGNVNTQADFYGLNLYEWCGNSTFESSGWAARTQEFSNYSIPVLMSEYGCNLVSPRPFTEVATLYGPQMTSIWSGGIVYEWTEEANNYGLVKVNDNSSITPLQDFYNLKQQLANINPAGVKYDSYSPDNKPSDCPSNSPTWQASAHLPPTPSEKACQCMVSSLSCVTSNQTASNNQTITDAFSLICGYTRCADITANATTGAYGKYSFCDDADKLSYEFNLYYQSQNKNPAACDFKGLAAITTPSRTNDDECATLSTTPTPSINSKNNGNKSSNADVIMSKGFDMWIYFVCSLLFVELIDLL
ncbi:1093_t:CDS:2 [Ambispora leptoticha]|uniref:1,3-beta-glucanosyltransferase n=1 Tax=Ambispora leptoticha TaxID=144679 RepID=A0A9N8ZXZ4_9GLOM|nr:1093_t:CDS:2 [Ambispora leptoticha]